MEDKNYRGITRGDLLNIIQQQAVQIEQATNLAANNAKAVDRLEMVVGKTAELQQGTAVQIERLTGIASQALTLAQENRASIDRGAEWQRQHELWSQGQVNRIESLERRYADTATRVAEHEVAIKRFEPVAVAYEASKTSSQQMWTVVRGNAFSLPIAITVMVVGGLVVGLLLKAFG